MTYAFPGLNSAYTVIVSIAIAAAAVACKSSGATTKPASSPQPRTEIVQPGAPGQAPHVITEAAATDLSKVQFTKADVAFMQGMIGHHSQAVEMVDLLKQRTLNPDLQKLGMRITVSQEDEIKMMQTWLKVRGQSLPTRTPTTCIRKR
jgi:Uncharacterized protein conserved in bacteria